MMDLRAQHPALKYIATALSSASIGAWICWFVFRAPQWACGPFNQDRAALWAAGVGAILAAGATLWAVVVAINGGKRAIENERSLRNEELAHTENLRHRSQAIIAAFMVPSLYELAFESCLWIRLIDDHRYDLATILKFINKFSLDTLNAVIEKLEILDTEGAQHFGLTYGLIKNISNQSTHMAPEISSRDAASQQNSRGDIRVLVEQLQPSAVQTFNYFEKLSGYHSSVKDPVHGADLAYKGMVARLTDSSITE
jgi:hypothetical protein